METSTPTVRSPFRRSPRVRAAGFSLIEITLSLGIIAFAFVTIFGLLPTGLNTFRRAMDISIGAQIAQELINDAQQTDFNTLKNGDGAGNGGTAGSFHYYDDQGNEVSDQKKTIYRGVLWVRPDVQIPGTLDVSQTVAVVAQVAHLPGQRVIAVKNGIWDDPSVSITTCTAMVARQK